MKVFKRKVCLRPNSKAFFSKRLNFHSQNSTFMQFILNCWEQVSQQIRRKTFAPRLRPQRPMRLTGAAFFSAAFKRMNDSGVTMIHEQHLIHIPHGIYMYIPSDTKWDDWNHPTESTPTPGEYSANSGLYSEEDFIMPNVNSRGNRSSS